MEKIMEIYIHAHVYFYKYYLVSRIGRQILYHCATWEAHKRELVSQRKE